MNLEDNKYVAAILEAAEQFGSEDKDNNVALIVLGDNDETTAYLHGKCKELIVSMTNAMCGKDGENMRFVVKEALDLIRIQKLCDKVGIENLGKLTDALSKLAKDIKEAENGKDA